MPYAKTVEKYPLYMRDAVSHVAQNEMDEVWFACESEKHARSMAARFYALFTVAGREGRPRTNGPSITEEAMRLAQDCNVVIPRVRERTVVLKNKNRDFAQRYKISYHTTPGELPLTKVQEQEIVARRKKAATIQMTERARQLLLRDGDWPTE